jgi:hypothetical protein
VSDSVLDLIDNVIDAHGDAMRWSPNAPDPTPAEAPRRYVTVTYRLILDEAFLDLRRAIAAATTAFTFMGQTYLKVVPADPVEIARQARLRRMRHLYRQRRR